MLCVRVVVHPEHRACRAGVVLSDAVRIAGAEFMVLARSLGPLEKNAGLRDDAALLPASFPCYRQLTFSSGEASRMICEPQTIHEKIA